MESSYLAILSSKGQLTVPKALREELHIEEGQHLLLEAVQEGLLVKKASFQTSDEDLEEAEWKELQKLASEKGKTYKSGKAFLKSLRAK